VQQQVRAAGNAPGQLLRTSWGVGASAAVVARPLQRQVWDGGQVLLVSPLQQQQQQQVGTALVAPCFTAASTALVSGRRRLLSITVSSSSNSRSSLLQGPALLQGGLGAAPGLPLALLGQLQVLGVNTVVVSLVGRRGRCRERLIIDVGEFLWGYVAALWAAQQQQHCEHRSGAAAAAVSSSSSSGVGMERLVRQDSRDAAVFLAVAVTARFRPPGQLLHVSAPLLLLTAGPSPSWALTAPLRPTQRQRQLWGWVLWCQYVVGVELLSQMGSFARGTCCSSHSSSGGSPFGVNPALISSSSSASSARTQRLVTPGVFGAAVEFLLAAMGSMRGKGFQLVARGQSQELVQVQHQPQPLWAFQFGAQIFLPGVARSPSAWYQVVALQGAGQASPAWCLLYTSNGARISSSSMTQGMSLAELETCLWLQVSCLGRGGYVLLAVLPFPFHTVCQCCALLATLDVPQVPLTPVHMCHWTCQLSLCSTQGNICRG
jgi:hypothetical protein